MKPKFHFVTLFPETVRPWLEASILGIAHEKGLFDFQIYQLRDYALDRHRVVDDVAYGGGGGMVLKAEPLVRALETITNGMNRADYRVIHFSPTGERLAAPMLKREARNLVAQYLLICGHYEGIDQRFIDGWVDQEISLGDFVVTGGELPALAFVDGLVRHLDGALGQETAAETESFSFVDTEGRPLLEYPHYTRPAEFRGREVPEVLLSGDHGAIAAWRLEQSEKKTQARRPDLLT